MTPSEYAESLRKLAEHFGYPEPTEEGLRRYEDTGGRYMQGEPCTCKPECDDPCKGQCGCQACGNAYGDFLSSE
jgi:hypothetical protein